MKGEEQKIHLYDMVCSLGERCMVAHQMRLNGLRSISNPFDWLISMNVEAVVDTLLTAGEKFFLKENIKLEDRGAEHLTATDCLTGFISLHDFEGKYSFDEEYIKFIEKYHHRIQRLLDMICKSSSILFVRTNVSEQDIEKLLTLQKLNTKARMDFLIINTCNTNEIRELPSQYDNVYIYTISEQPDCQYDVWMGNHAHWKQVLSKYALKGYSDWLVDSLKTVTKEKSLVIWGFGGAGKKIVSHLQASRVNIPIAWIIDSNSDKWGDIGNGLEIKGSASLVQHLHDTLVLICVYGDATGIVKQLVELGYPRKNVMRVVYEDLTPVKIAPV